MGICDISREQNIAHFMSTRCGQQNRSQTRCHGRLAAKRLASLTEKTRSLLSLSFFFRTRIIFQPRSKRRGLLVSALRQVDCSIKVLYTLDEHIFPTNKDHCETYTANFHAFELPRSHGFGRYVGQVSSLHSRRISPLTVSRRASVPIPRLFPLDTQQRQTFHFIRFALQSCVPGQQLRNQQSDLAFVKLRIPPQAMTPA